MERLQKQIAASGYTSRRKAEELIKTGHVLVNGKKVTELGTKVSSNDEITIDGINLSKEDKVYYLLNKPRGIIASTKDEKNRKTVIDLINTTKRIYPVGRLDYDTTGLIILTNDGDFANTLMHPSNKIDKVYIAKINGILTKEQESIFKKGMTIDKTKLQPAKIKTKKINKKNNTSIVEVTIHEGKNHQIKKMFKKIGLDVLKLKREKIGFLTLDGLSSKEYRIITPKEIKKLYNLAQKK